MICLDSTLISHFIACCGLQFKTVFTLPGCTQGAAGLILIQVQVAEQHPRDWIFLHLFLLACVQLLLPLGSQSLLYLCSAVALPVKMLFITLWFHVLVERMSSCSKLRAHCSLKHPYRCRMGVMGLLVQVCTPNQPSALDIPFSFFEATWLCEYSEKSKLCSKKFLGMCMAEEQKRDHFGSQQRFLPRIVCKCSFRKGLSKKQ